MALWNEVPTESSGVRAVFYYLLLRGLEDNQPFSVIPNSQMSIEDFFGGSRFAVYGFLRSTGNFRKELATLANNLSYFQLERLRSLKERGVEGTAEAKSSKGFIVSKRLVPTAQALI